MVRQRVEDRTLLYVFKCNTCQRSMYFDQGTSFREASCKYCHGRAIYVGPAYAEIGESLEESQTAYDVEEKTAGMPVSDECCQWHSFSRGIAGMGPEAPTYMTDTGGKHSDTGYRFDTIDPKSMFVMARILDRGGKKYGDDNWRSISVRDNINHALAHLEAHLAGDDSDDHLGDAFCRTMFALAVHLQGGPVVKTKDTTTYDLPQLRSKGI